MIGLVDLGDCSVYSGWRKMDFIWIGVIFLLGSQQGFCDHFPGHVEESDDVSISLACDTESCESDADILATDYLQEEYLSPIEADGRRRMKRTPYVFPQSRELINTSFTCEGKPYIPGFYADVEANCQIFHVCYTAVTEHFLCPPNTAFDQKNLVCNTLDKFQCHMTPMNYDSNSFLSIADKKREPRSLVRSMLDEDDPPKPSDSAYISDPESVETSLLKIFLLAKLLEASDIVQMMEKENNTEPSSRQGRNVEFSTSPDVIENLFKKVLNEIFPLLPVRFNVSTSLPRESIQVSWPFSPQRHSSSRSERVLEILRMIFKTIEHTSGIISGISRANLATNYLNYLLHSSLKTRDVTV